MAGVCAAASVGAGLRLLGLDFGATLTRADQVGGTVGIVGTAIALDQWRRERARRPERPGDGPGGAPPAAPTSRDLIAGLPRLNDEQDKREDGDGVVVWQGQGPDSSVGNVNARRVTSDGEFDAP